MKATNLAKIFALLLCFANSLPDGITLGDLPASSVQQAMQEIIANATTANINLSSLMQQFSDNEILNYLNSPQNIDFYRLTLLTHLDRTRAISLAQSMNTPNKDDILEYLSNGTITTWLQNQIDNPIHPVNQRQVDDGEYLRYDRLLRRLKVNLPNASMEAIFSPNFIHNIGRAADIPRRILLNFFNELIATNPNLQNLYTRLRQSSKDLLLLELLNWLRTNDSYVNELISKLQALRDQQNRLLPLFRATNPRQAGASQGLIEALNHVINSFRQVENMDVTDEIETSRADQLREHIKTPALTGYAGPGGIWHEPDLIIKAVKTHLIGLNDPTAVELGNILSIYGSLLCYTITLLKDISLAAMHGPSPHKQMILRWLLEQHDALTKEIPLLNISLAAGLARARLGELPRNLAEPNQFPAPSPAMVALTAPIRQLKPYSSLPTTVPTLVLQQNKSAEPNQISKAKSSRNDTKWNCNNDNHSNQQSQQNIIDIHVGDINSLPNWHFTPFPVRVRLVRNGNFTKISHFFELFPATNLMIQKNNLPKNLESHLINENKKITGAETSDQAFCNPYIPVLKAKTRHNNSKPQWFKIARQSNLGKLAGWLALFVQFLRTMASFR